MDASEVFSVALKVIFNFRTFIAGVACYFFSFLANLISGFDSAEFEAAKQVSAARFDEGEKGEGEEPTAR